MNIGFLIENRTAVLLSMVIIVSFVISNIPITLVRAETGKGEDILKVILTVFGIDKSKGDVIAIVTANNGGASRVKFLDSEAPYVVPLPNSTARGSSNDGLIEYVATFTLLYQDITLKFHIRYIFSSQKQKISYRIYFLSLLSFI